VGPRAGLDGCRKFTPTRIRSPECPSRSESVSQPNHTANIIYKATINFISLVTDFDPVGSLFVQEMFLMARAIYDVISIIVHYVTWLFFQENS
jgi:hypothetical protein